MIVLLADALREDFVEFDTNMDRFLPLDRYGAYQGKRLSLFADKKRENPENTLFFPFESETPTVTTVRVKGMLTGGLSTFFETSSEFGSKEVTEDNILY